MQQEYSLQQLYYKIKKVRLSSSDSQALKRFNAVERFERALSKGLTSVEAASVVGVPRSTLYRWQKRKTLKLDSLISRSRRPKRLRKAKNRSAEAIRIQDLRQNWPRWGKRKITKLLQREGTCISESAVGRIISGLLKHLNAVCTVSPCHTAVVYTRATAKTASDFINFQFQ